MNASLTWWNDHAKAMGFNTENAMTCLEMKVMLIEEYCPRDEMKILEHKL